MSSYIKTYMATNLDMLQSSLEALFVTYKLIQNDNWCKIQFIIYREPFSW